MPTSSRCKGHEFAVNFCIIALFCRVDVGIDPYNQTGSFLPNTDSDVSGSLISPEEPVQDGGELGAGSDPLRGERTV